jgi:pimeloyl-ACP methyl ester carboxylesterase
LEQLRATSAARVVRPCAIPGGREIQRHTIDLHGVPMSLLTAGRRRGRPVVVFVHGLAGGANVWGPVISLLAGHVQVIACDLLGHGESAAPANADYTPGAHACRLRDLLKLLGVRRAHLVGHSFGGGVGMSFAYQFPERTQSLTLIASGGLGPELSVALRAASLPGAALGAHALARFAPSWVGRLAQHSARAFGLTRTEELETLRHAMGVLGRPDRRRAFLETLRGSVNWAGQRVDATDRLHMLAELPTLLIAGTHDRCIPHWHTLRAHEMLPHSRLETLPAGHFPHREYPERVAELITELIGGEQSRSHRATEPATEAGVAHAITA